jgi:hypothetical protein
MLTTRKLNNRHAPLLALAAILGGPAFAQSVRLIVDPIDETGAWCWRATPAARRPGRSSIAARWTTHFR